MRRSSVLIVVTATLLAGSGGLFGHSIGLSDLDDSGKLTMHFQGTLGYTGQRTLGRGDILGARGALRRLSGTARGTPQRWQTVSTRTC
jgi:hypothetical protein